MKNETHIPTEQTQAQEDTRFQNPHEDCRGKESPQPPPPRRAQVDRRLTFPKRYKLTDRAEYRRLSKQGQRLIGQAMCIDWLKSNLPQTRLGLTVSARYGAAHERNLFKRRIREAFRTSRLSLPPSLDINVLPRQRAKTATFAELSFELIRLIGKIGQNKHVPPQ